MVRRLSEPQVRSWLLGKGILPAKIQGIVDGMDFLRPVYTSTLDPGEKIVQFRDRPSMTHPLGDLGRQWFGLASMDSASMGKLGIGSGLAGRTRHELTVVRAVEVPESTAKPMPGHPADRYTGQGGATQMFLPDRGLSSLR